MKKLLLFFSSLLIIMYTASCGDSNQKPEEKSSPQVNEEKDNDNNGESSGDYSNLVEGMKNMEEMMKKGGSYEAVDFRKLKNFLPEELDGMKRTSATGEKTNAFGMKVSEAKGQYENDDRTSSINITITDLGSLQGFAGMAAFGWAFAEIDKETDTGYERTTSYSGHKAFERYDTERNGGNIEVLIAERFMVKSEGNNVSMDQIQSSIGAVDLDGLGSMKEEGRKTN
jgi:hypothetical protein